MTDHPGRDRSSALLISQIKRANSQTDRQTDSSTGWADMMGISNQVWTDRSITSCVCAGFTHTLPVISRWIRKLFGHVTEKLIFCPVGGCEAFYVAQYQAGPDWAPSWSQYIHNQFWLFQLDLWIKFNCKKAQYTKNLQLTSLVYYSSTSQWWIKRNQQTQASRRSL